MTEPVKPRLLLLEDDVSLQELFKSSMEAEGYQIEVATDGAAGLSTLARFKPHLIVLDLMMPEVNGFDFLERLKGTAAEATPLVILTAYHLRRWEAKLRQIPSIQGIYQKPITYAFLAQECRRILAALGNQA